MGLYDRYYKNFSTLDPVYSGKALGGNWVVPNAEGVNYPIIHQLGAESYVPPMRSGWNFDLVDNGDDTYTYTSNGATDSKLSTIFCNTTSVSLDSERFEFTFDVVIHSGSLTITGFFGADGQNQLFPTGSQELVNGANKFVVGKRPSDNAIYLYGEETDTCSFTISNVSIKEITIPSTSYLYYLDYVTQKLVGLSSDGA